MEARAENPDDLNLVLTEANVHYTMGNTEKFKELLEYATKRDPNNAELQYNLGVIAADADDFENAKIKCWEIMLNNYFENFKKSNEFLDLIKIFEKKRKKTLLPNLTSNITKVTSKLK